MWIFMKSVKKNAAIVNMELFLQQHFTHCASSVVITQLYLDHIIGAGAMMAGLLVNAGVGLLILFRLNRDRVQNLKIVGVLYGLGVFWGIIIEFAGIVF